MILNPNNEHGLSLASPRSMFCHQGATEAPVDKARDSGRVEKQGVSEVVSAVFKRIQMHIHETPVLSRQLATKLPCSVTE